MTGPTWKKGSCTMWLQQQKHSWSPPACSESSDEYRSRAWLSKSPGSSAQLSANPRSTQQKSRRSKATSRRIAANYSILPASPVPLPLFSTGSEIKAGKTCWPMLTWDRCKFNVSIKVDRIKGNPASLEAAGSLGPRAASFRESPTAGRETRLIPRALPFW